MRRSSLARSALALGVTFAVSSCAFMQPVPKAPLREFEQAVAQARQAGDEVLDLYALDVEANRALRARVEGVRVAREFDPQAVIESARSNPDAVAARRVALRAVESYAQILVVLAEGKSVEEVQASADGLVSSVGAISAMLSLAPVPGLGLAVPLVKTVLGELERARTVAEFREATTNGEKVVLPLLAFLEDETKLYYDLAVTLYDARRGPLLAGASTSIAEILAIASEHAAPADPEFLDQVKADLDAALATTTFGIEEFALVSGGNAAFAASAQSQVRRLVEDVKVAAQGENALIERLDAKRRVLETYVLLLDRVEQSLKQLRVALDRPLHVQAQFAQTLDLALRLRRDILALRAGLEGLG